MVREKVVVHIMVEKRLELDNVDTMSVTFVDREIELTSIEELMRAVQELIATALAKAFSFL